MKKLFLQTIFILTLMTTAQAKGKHHEEITSDSRNEAALVALKNAPDTVQVYARGLVCESCAIGIRKKIQKLDFVNTKKQDKGVLLNVQTQLVSVSIKAEESVDQKALSKAIKGAGYEPVTLFQLTKGKTLMAASLAK